MMGFLTALNEAKGAVIAATAIGGSAITLNTLHVSQDDFDVYVSSNRVQTILHLQDQSAREGAPSYLCRAITEEFAALCTEQPKHYFCTDPSAKKEIFAKAGC